MKSYRYVTIFTDFSMLNHVCEFLHSASSLPEAIKAGRAYVRDLNHQLRLHFFPGKRYQYISTYRSR